MEPVPAGVAQVELAGFPRRVGWRGAGPAARLGGDSAVIPYDSVSYALEFSTSAPARLVPDSLTRVVQSWRAGRTVVLWGVIKVIAAVLIGLAALLAYRAFGYRSSLQTSR